MEAPSSYVVSTPVAGVGQEDGPDSSIGAINQRGHSSYLRQSAMLSIFKNIHKICRNVSRFSHIICDPLNWNSNVLNVNFTSTGQSLLRSTVKVTL